jgi:trk system potassium uptake protein
MQVAVLGLGSFGFHAAKALSRLGCDVIAIDTSEEIIESIKDHVSQSLAADVTQENVLRALGVVDVDAALVAIGDMDVSIVTVVLLRKIGVSHIIARALSPLHKQVLNNVGASEVLLIEQEMADEIAKSLMSPQLIKRMSLPGDLSLATVRCPTHWVGKTLKQLNTRKHFGFQIAVIQKKEPSINELGETIFRIISNDNPGPNDKLEDGHQLLIIGSSKKIDDFMQETQ